MGDQSFNIPIGFRFDPTDEELIRGFLFQKVMGFQLPWNGIEEKELYGDDASPWNVFSDIDDENSPSVYCNTKRESGKTKKTVYVFTKVTKASNSKKRISRTAGCGTWNGQTGPKNIMHSTTGDIIGRTTMLSFKRSTTTTAEDAADDSDFGHWIMHEYSLRGAALKEIGQRNNDIVLCKITKSVKDSDRQQAAAAVGDGGVDDEIRVSNNNKRAAEELQQEEESGCKRQKSDGEGFLEVDGDLNIDDGIDIQSLINFDFDIDELASLLP